jgi:hypothetical protein
MQDEDNSAVIPVVQESSAEEEIQKWLHTTMTLISEANTTTDQQFLGSALSTDLIPFPALQAVAWWENGCGAVGRSFSFQLDPK